MHENNRKTIIFKSKETKNFIDALIQNKSKKTGVAMMRLVENALICSLGFKDSKLNEWCCEYDASNIASEYSSLIYLLPDNTDIFAFYKLMCKHNDIAISHNSVCEDFGVVDENEFAVEKTFFSKSREDVEKSVLNFIYNNADTVMKNPIPISDIIPLLQSVDDKKIDKKR